MNKYISIILLILTCNVSAENLCTSNNDREPEFTITESELTKENAEASLMYLEEVINNGKSAGEWVVLPNHLKIIEGYVLRQEALQSKQPNAISRFCTWLEAEGFWYD